MKFIIKNKCPVCNSDKLTTFLKREKVPSLQNIVIDTPHSAKNITRGDITLDVCESCGFVFNSSFKNIDYNETYDNSQTYSPSFDAYINTLVKYLIIDKGVQNKIILEIGCGKGLFIKKMIENKTYGNIGYGFDPSYLGPLNLFNNRLKFFKKYYGPEDKNLSSDIIICRHVIEHISDPISFLKTIRLTLVNSSNTRVFFETPCVDWILKNNVFWDFFYEHCSYFNINSLRTAFEISGFTVENIQHTFNGQYLLLEAKIKSDKHITKNKTNTHFLTKVFAKSEQTLREKWSVKLKKIKKQGNIALWGAGAKGVTFANLLDPTAKMIECIIDINPKKQEHYLSGTGHPIINYKNISKYNINTIILMNPNYREEIEHLLSYKYSHINLIKV